jgi:hypothetical protein
MKTFYDVRNLPGLKKKPSTSELIDWLKLLVAEDIPLSALQSADNKVPCRRWWAPAEERAGREPVRKAGVHEPAQPLTPLWRFAPFPRSRSAAHCGRDATVLRGGPCTVAAGWVSP